MGIFVLHGRERELEPLLKQLDLPHGDRLPEDFPVEAVIRWGTKVEEPEGVLTLNRLKPVLRAGNRPEREEILKLHGLKPGILQTRAERSGFPMYTHEYMIPVFHLEVLTVYEKKAAQPLLARSASAIRPAFRELGEGNWSHPVRRAVKDSLKAVYALGLDFALVRTAVTADSRTVIVDVEPNPKLMGGWVRRLVEAIRQFAADVRKQAGGAPAAMLGADPEFVLQNREGKITPASRFMDKEGAVGCDNVIVRGQRTFMPLVELRPEPASDPRQLVRHLRRSLLQATRLITDRDLAWVAGGMPVRGIPLGGHIHISGIWLHSRLVRMLDNYLALPMLLTEEERDRYRRPRYGYLGDIRRKAHGGFEYRSLASWLGSPRLSAGVLCLTRCIIDHYGELKQEPLTRFEVQQAFYEGNKTYLRPVVRELWGELERLPAYSTYRKELDALKQIVFGGKVLPAGDFRGAWKLPAASELNLPAGRKTLERL